MTLFILIAVGVIGVASLIFWPRIARWLEGPAPTQDDEPDEVDDRPDSGADEEYPKELRAASQMLPSPDLIRPAEQMVADHEALSGISTALDDFDRIVSTAISRFLISQPVVLLRLPSSIEETGEMPAVVA